MHSMNIYKLKLMTKKEQLLCNTNPATVHDVRLLDHLAVECCNGDRFLTD